MKKLHYLALIGLLLVGCSSPPPVEKAPPPNMPGWALNIPSQEGYIYGVGSAQKQNPQLARTAAIGLARDEIARALELKVSSMFKNFMQESGIGENAQALEFTESVTKQVASTTLNGSTVKEVELTSDGRMWALVELNLSAVKKAALDNAKKQEALYNEFKASQSFDELENAINEMK